MQWKTNTKMYQDAEDQDVYSDVKTSFPADGFSAQREAQEFDLASVQQKLGLSSAENEPEMSVSTPDTLPSTSTLNMNFERQYSPQAASATKISTKTKVMAVSYVLVVLALVLAVTLCGVSVSGAFGSAAVLDASYSEVASQVAALTEQVQTEDYAALITRATELGYIDSSSSNTLTYTEIETRPAQNFNIQTNWFDSLCDWFSNAFGG